MRRLAKTLPLSCSLNSSRYNEALDTIRSRKIVSILENDREFRVVTNHQIRSDQGARVENYQELVEKVAQLSFYNPEHVLLFRGQTKEYPNSRGNASIKPSIFRPATGTRPPDPLELADRYRRLARADQILADQFSQSRFLGRQRIVRHRLLRWAILQHYEVCATPLVDVTQSLRVAASFATNEVIDTSPVVYVLAVPSIAGSISASSEQGVQTIRLSSICPPDAKRPYFQEGYLLAEYPDLASIHEKEKYRPHEIDFGRRVIAKFRLPRIDFWSRDYTPIPKEALYPNERDPLVEFSENIKSELAS